ncbi:hypothetical protein WDU94_012059 [Cyamophila willieti]
MACEEFIYSDDNFNLMSFWSDKTQSYLEQILQDTWEEKLKKNLFRYKLNITQTKVLPGKYKFVLKLNPDRITNRRPPEDLVSINQKFDPSGFNFTKISPNEIMFKINKKISKGHDDLVIVNVSPLDNYHCMFIPSVSQCLNQVITLPSLCKAIEIMFLTKSPSFRIGFNSLCAFASVNHLHFHCYYLTNKMLLETIPVKHLAGPCYVLLDYPARGFVFQISSVQNYIQQIRSVFRLIEYFQRCQVPHNIYITRGVAVDSSTDGVNCQVLNNMRDVIRVYVWARSSSAGLKRVLYNIKPALCELFGHITVKDQSEFDSVTEEVISNMLRNLVTETFEKVYQPVINLFESQDSQNLGTA